jgi:signal transduction histidine kinase/ligand-binding sensor domain-containing protein
MNWNVGLLRCAPAWLGLAALAVAAAIRSAAAGTATLSDEYLLEAWDTGHGLPQNTVTAITQTRDGYLWLGTPNGLACFDGVRFQVFDPTSLPAFPARCVKALLATPEGDLWVGCEGGAAIRLHQGRFAALTGTNLLAFRSVLSLEQTPDGRVWLGTDAGLLVCQEGRLLQAEVPRAAPEGPVRALLGVGTNAPWALAGNHLVETRSGQRAALPLADTENGLATWTGLAPSAAQNAWLFGPMLARLTLSAPPAVAVQPAGLAQGDRINAACERSNGEVWLGTQSGELKRLAGQVTTYLLPGAAAARPIRCLFEDREHNLWLGTEGGGLLRIKSRRMRMFGAQDGLSDGLITSLCPDGRRDFWVGCHAAGIRHWHDGAFTPFTANGALPTNAIIWSLLQTRDRSLWIGSEGAGLLFWRNGKLQHFGPAEGVTESAILAFCEAADGTVWFGGRDGGLYHVTKNALSRFGPEDGFTSRNLTSLAAEPKGGLWIGCNGDGLYHFAEGQFKRYTQADGLGSDEVRALRRDADGTLWVGTSGGLTRLKGGRWVNFTTRQGLWNNVISQILVDMENKALWLGSNQGIFRIRKESFEDFVQGKIASLEPIVYGRAEGLDCLECSGGFSPAGLLELPTPNPDTVNSRLWFSTLRGLVRLDPLPLLGMGRGISGDHIAFGKAQLHLQPGDATLDLGDVVAGGNGFGTGQGVGIYAHDGTEEQKSVAFNLSDAGTTPEARFHRTKLPFVDGVFIPNGGLSPDHHVVISSTGLKVELPETTGQAWGCIASGLRPRAWDVFNPSDWTRLGPRFVWMPGNQGITFDLDAMRKATGRTIDRFTALAGNLHVGPACFYVFLDGQLVARRSGVVRDQDRVERGVTALDIPIGAETRFLTLVSTDDKDDVGFFNLQPPPVTIEEVLCDGKAQHPEDAPRPPSGTNSYPSSLHPEFASLTLAPGSGRLEFKYAALSLVAPEKVRFRYRLEPLEENWIEAGDRRVASYANLRPRIYRFRVIACNNDGVWNETGASVAVLLQPHLWQVWWFTPLWVTALVVGVTGSSILLIRRRHRRRLDQLEQLRALETERTRIARDIHDDVGASMTHIALLSELAQTDLAEPDQVRPHINEIFTTARQVARSVDEIVWAINPKNDPLEVSLAYVCKNAQTYLRIAGISCRLEMPDEVPARSLSSTARHQLYLVVREALNNVVKHARASEVHLRVAVESNALAFRIADNGCGFDPIAQAAGHRPDPDGRGGNGLENMAQRLKLVGGRFNLESRPGQGTVIEVEVPLQPAAN